jgi:5-methylcytosine-specific restriction endonuclease McrA
MFKRFFTTHRKSLPKAVREQVWLKDMGKEFEGKCMIDWCANDITVFNFQVGHNIPVSKGGSDKLNNLHAICCRCNSCMGNKYTITEWRNKW